MMPGIIAGKTKEKWCHLFEFGDLFLWEHRENTGARAFSLSATATARSFGARFRSLGLWLGWFRSWCWFLFRFGRWGRCLLLLLGLLLLLLIRLENNWTEWKWRWLFAEFRFGWEKKKKIKKERMQFNYLLVGSATEMEISDREMGNWPSWRGSWKKWRKNWIESRCRLEKFVSQCWPNSEINFLEAAERKSRRSPMKTGISRASSSL